MSSQTTKSQNSYADYHIYRAEQAPKTYGEVNILKKQYEQQKTPDHVFNTEIRMEQKKIKQLEKQYEEKLQEDKLREKQEYYEQKAFEDNLMRAIHEREMEMLGQGRLQMETIEHQERGELPIRQYHSQTKDMIYEPATEYQVWSG